MGAPYELPPERLARWLDRWQAAHAPVASTRMAAEAATFTAAGGATVTCRPVIAGLPEHAADGFDPGPLLAHVDRARTVGVLLVRLGAHAAGVFDEDTLIASKVDRRLVKGRHRAGGQSQRRFERRREGQARDSLRAAADVAARVLLPHAGRLDAVVTGGDRAALREVLADPRLAALAARAEPLVLEVPEPRHDILRALPHRLRATLVSPSDAGG